MPVFANYHSHSAFSDGEGEPEEYVLSAIEQGVSIYGFSDHAPLPFACDWAMKTEELVRYSQQIDVLSELYKGRIELLKSLELDYLPGMQYSMSDFARLFKLDYTIGSIHFVDAFTDGTPWNIDTGRELFEKGLKFVFSGNCKRAVERYFELTIDMLINMKPDIVGHIDKICMYNDNQRYFNENDAWYLKIIDAVLEKLRQLPAVLELNTRGFYKGESPRFFPSEHFMHRVKLLGIPVVINSDCHHPDEVNAGYMDALYYLKTVGLKSIAVFSDRKWHLEAI